MTTDLINTRGRTCESCKHLSEDEHSAQVLIDFGYKGHYWKCEFRSHYNKDEIFPREVIVYTCGMGLCSSWEPK